MAKRNDTPEKLRAIIAAKENAMKLQIAETDHLRRETYRLRRIIKKLKTGLSEPEQPQPETDR